MDLKKINSSFALRFSVKGKTGIKKNLCGWKTSQLWQQRICNYIDILVLPNKIKPLCPKNDKKKITWTTKTPENITPGQSVKALATRKGIVIKRKQFSETITKWKHEFYVTAPLENWRGSVSKDVFKSYIVFPTQRNNLGSYANITCLVCIETISEIVIKYVASCYNCRYHFVLSTWGNEDNRVFKKISECHVWSMRRATRELMSIWRSAGVG